MRPLFVAVLSVSIPIAEQAEGAERVFAILLVEICATGLYILDHSFLIIVIVIIGLRVIIFNIHRRNHIGKWDSLRGCGLIVDR